MPAPNASYSITMRVELDCDPRGIGRLATAVHEAGSTVTAVDVVESPILTGWWWTSPATPATASTPRLSPK